MFGLAWLSPKLLKWAGGAILVIGLVIAIKVGISNWTDSIRDNERLVMKGEQLEQVLKDNKALEKKTQELEQVNNEILANTKVANDRLIERHTEIKTYIQSPEAQASNRETSDVIKNTIRMLGDEE